MPLIKPNQGVIRPNLLVYPAGARPGFDPLHPAAQNCGFSGISAPGGIFKNILTGALGSNATGPSTSTSSIYEPIGPITSYEAGVDNTSFPFVSSTTALTLAAIFKRTQNPSSASFVMNTAAAGASGMGDFLITNFAIANSGGANIDTVVPTINGPPFFFACSYNAAINVAWVIVRMDTGQTYSGTSPTGNAMTAGDGSIWIGNRGANSRQLVGGIAAAMAANAFMSERQLRDWAKDPWGFWYPRKTVNLVNSAGIATFLAAWAQGSNLPVIGTGNY